MSTRPGFVEFICLFIIRKTVKFFFLNLVREATLESIAVSTNSSEFLLKSVFHFFSHTFLGTNFLAKYTNNVIETTSYFVGQLSKNDCVYYVFEHLKYCTQINEY